MAFMHIDKLSKKKQSGWRWGGERGFFLELKDLFYKYFGLVLADGDGWALMKLSGHVKV